MTHDPVVMYLIARRDLNMSPGKLAAQVGHGVQYVLVSAFKQKLEKLTTPLWTRAVRWCKSLWIVTFETRDYVEQWAENEHTKIVLAVNSIEEFRSIEVLLGTLAKVVVDAGRTEISSGTRTVLAMIPLPKSEAQKYVGHLKLYR